MLELVAAGRPTKEIAATMRRSEGAVKKHVARLLERYAAPNRAALIAAAFRAGDIPAEGRETASAIQELGSDARR